MVAVQPSQASPLVGVEGTSPHTGWRARTVEYMTPTDPTYFPQTGHSPVMAGNTPNKGVTTNRLVQPGFHLGHTSKGSGKLCWPSPSWNLGMVAVHISPARPRCPAIEGFPLHRWSALPFIARREYIRLARRGYIRLARLAVRGLKAVPAPTGGRGSPMEWPGLGLYHPISISSLPFQITILLFEENGEVGLWSTWRAATAGVSLWSDILISARRFHGSINPG